jgi:methylated-DNA-[protein]-cysteine S-methyltransferase
MPNLALVRAGGWRFSDLVAASEPRPKTASRSLAAALDCCHQKEAIMNRLFTDHLDTPLGRFVVIAEEDGRLHAAGFDGGHQRMDRVLRDYAAAIRPTPAADPGGVTAALARYFAGDLGAIDDLAVATPGTEFQRKVWQALRAIPCGETWSYGELARHIGRPKAVRAVGLANGANPVAVVVPCHRVIGSNGTLTGYGGGLERKRWLLQHESQRSTGAQLCCL